MIRPRLNRAHWVIVTLLAGAVTACSGGGGTASPSTPTAPITPAAPVATSVAVSAGDGQTARIGTAVSTAPSVIVRDQRGAAMAGVPVSFSVASGGGTLTGSASVTDATGSASSGAWKLGSTPGQNALRVQVNAGASPTATITATARLPYWTVMVYMAADNTLTEAGLQDIDEMEAAGANPEVQVVVQAEFSPSVFGLKNATPTSQHLPNFNTFRYLVPAAGGPKTSYGPDGSVQDIGNVDMTSPSVLRAFVQWAAQNYPAEKTALVLWNHGGGYSGLIEDVTSAGARLMTVSELQSGLTGTTTDVLDFDMCLMAGYEILQKLQGLARTVVLSEETEPPAGNPYDRILAQWYAQPTMTPQQAATMIVDQYHASYAGDKASTTLSAFDMSGFSAFESALNALATSLRTNIVAYRQTLLAFLTKSQRYEYPMLTDLVDIVDSLNARVADATLRGQLTAVRSALTSSGFRLRSQARTGAESGANNVVRSTGLHVLLPTGTLADLLPSTGPGSFASYRTQWGTTAWATFVEAWLTGTQASPFRDLGTTRWEVYTVWDTASKRRGADLDIWVLEPNGNLFIPYLGTVTPNGHLTGESFLTGAYYEGYQMNRYAQIGRYKFYADLWTDPGNARPLVDILYRNNPATAFTSLYAPNYPQMSRLTSWRVDPNVTFAKIEAGQYTDVRYLSFLDITATTNAEMRDASIRTQGSFQSRPGGVTQATDLTRAQFDVVKRLREFQLRRPTADGIRPTYSLVPPTSRQPE